MDFPSAELVQLLTETGLGTRRDLERCRPIVKRLSRDLPAFDSVWIDALVQRGVLTRFQAQNLEDENHARLTAGAWVLIDQLEPGEHCHTFHGRQARHEAALKIFPRHADLPADFFSRFEFLASKLNQIANGSHAHFSGPRECLRLPDRFVLISSFVSGRTLQELLVRRGRFAPGVVAEIGLQLVNGLAELETQRLVHGDIRLNNVRIDSSGRAVLVDAGIRPLLPDDYDLHTDIPLRRLEGIAPERIGTGHPADSRSDLYALGCLLWQLLTSRPPFPTADPLARIAAHQQHDVADVRDWSPDVPAWLAELIARLTQRDPDKRPKSFRDVAERWGQPARSGKRRLAKFQAEFEGTQTIDSGRGALLAPALTTAVLLAAGFGLWQMQTGDKNPLLLQAPGAAAKEVSSEGTVDERTAEELAEPAIVPVPAPDATGRIALESGREYELSDISFAGTLRMSLDGGSVAKLHVKTPIRLSAGHVILENIAFVGRTNQTSDSLLKIQAQTLTVDRCSAVVLNPVGSIFDWQADDPHDRSGSRIAVRDCHLLGNAAAFTLRTPPRILQIDNVLKVGDGSLLRLSEQPRAGRDSHIQLQNVTLRETGSLLRMVVSDSAARGVVQIRMTDCVFALKEKNRAALLEFLGDALPKTGQPIVQLSAPPRTDASLVAAGLEDAVFLNRSVRQIQSVPPELIRLGGVIATPLTFVGTRLQIPADSVVKDFEAPRMSQSVPGYSPLGHSPAP